MSEEVEIAKEWLTKYYESAKAGRTCAYTLKEYIAQLEADSERLDQFFKYSTDLMELKEDSGPKLPNHITIHACVPMNRAAFDAKVKSLESQS